MSSFSPEALAKKLHELNNSTPSIQTLSLWLIHHRKHAKIIVKVWKKELIRIPQCGRKLTLMYLANDVVQNSKKKGAEFWHAFASILPSVYGHLGSQPLDTKSASGVQRLLAVWTERGVFSAAQLATFRSAYESGNSSVPTPATPAVAGDNCVSSGADAVTLHQNTTSNTSTTNTTTTITRKRSRSSLDSTTASKLAAVGDREMSGDCSVGDNGVEVDESGVMVADVHDVAARTPTGVGRKKEVKEVCVTLSPHSPPRDPPEPDELIQALEDLEKSASSDAETRQKIATLPADVSDVTQLQKLSDRASGFELMQRVGAAVVMLADYNGRLSHEMDQRRRVSRMLQDFTQAQKDLLAQAERTLEEYRHKLERVYLVREELKSHIQNLPDISQLPSVTGAPPALPSAGDLFS